MEYREPSRIVASERRADGPIEDADSPARFRRFEFVRPAGRLDIRRILAAAVLLLSIAIVVAYLGRRALDASVNWLHHQPRYQLPFEKIELLTPPPECFRGGSSRFLERVRATAATSEETLETLPLLDLSPERLENVFKRFPWVEKVESIAFPPRRVVVGLEYTEPSAVVWTEAGEQFAVDRQGRLLPLDDVDVERLDRPIRITGKGIVAPAASRLGLLWKTETPDHPERAEIDRRILQAARLAGFFNEPDRKRQAREAPALRVLVIAAIDPYQRGLFVQNADNATILWGEGPGEEKPDEPGAEEKWRMLAARAGNKALDAPGKPGFWRFMRDDLVFLPTIQRP